MDSTSTNATHSVVHESRVERLRKVAAGAPLAEAITGIGTIVLAIIGLAHVLPMDMAAVATILIGISLLFEGGSVAASTGQFPRTAAGANVDTADLAGAMTVEFLGGIAGVILGILALINIESQTLVAVSLIVFGATCLLGGGTRQFTYGPAGDASEEKNWQMLREAMSAASASGMLIGLATLVLGILAVLGANSLVLSLTGFLLLGVSVLLSGTAIGSKMMNRLRA